MDYFYDISLLIFNNNEFRKISVQGIEETKNEYQSIIKNNVTNNFSFLYTYCRIIDDEEFLILQEIFLKNIKDLTSIEINKLNYYFSSVKDLKKYFYLFPEFYFTKNNFDSLCKSNSLLSNLYLSNEIESYGNHIHLSEFSENILLNSNTLNTFINEFKNIKAKTDNDIENINFLLNVINSIPYDEISVVVIKKI